MAVTTSRAFRVQGPDKPAAQLPLIDMCNHSFAPNCQAWPSFSNDPVSELLCPLTQQAYNCTRFLQLCPLSHVPFVRCRCV